MKLNLVNETNGARAVLIAKQAGHELNREYILSPDQVTRARKALGGTGVCGEDGRENPEIVKDIGGFALVTALPDARLDESYRVLHARIGKRGGRIVVQERRGEDGMWHDLPRTVSEEKYEEICGNGIDNPRRILHAGRSVYDDPGYDAEGKLMGR